MSEGKTIALATFPGLRYLQFLIAFQYKNMEGEGLGDLVTHAMPGGQKLDGAQ